MPGQKIITLWNWSENKNNALFPFTTVCVVKPSPVSGLREAVHKLHYNVYRLEAQVCAGAAYVRYMCGARAVLTCTIASLASLPPRSQRCHNTPPPPPPPSSLSLNASVRTLHPPDSQTQTHPSDRLTSNQIPPSHMQTALNISS